MTPDPREQERFDVEAREAVKVLHSESPLHNRDHFAMVLYAAIDRLDASVHALREAREEVERITGEFESYKFQHNKCVDDAIDEQVAIHDEIEAKRDGIEASLDSIRQSLAALIKEMEQDAAKKRTYHPAVAGFSSVWIEAALLEKWAQRLRALVERPGQEQK